MNRTIMTPNWQEPHFTELSVLNEWLLDPSSLTAKLKAIAPDFRVELLFQEQQPCQNHEAEFLGIKPTDTTIVREVLLYCHNQPWVYARSILPLAALSEADQALAKMGTNPLGEQLFSRPDIKPGRIQIASFSTNTKPGQLNTYYYKAQSSLWGRRRMFHLQHGAISVAEVFLSPTPCYAC